MSDLNQQFARKGAEVTIEIFHKLTEDDLKQNIFFSPFSIQACAALAFAGSSGETADEIANGMKFVSNIPSEVTETFQYALDKYNSNPLVKVANKVYVAEGHALKDSYIAVTKEHYYAEAENINFAENKAAATTMNSWVEDKTAGKITNLIGPNDLDASTRLVLLNAMHFKGQWFKKFDENGTRKADFWITNKDSINIDFMNKKSNFRYGNFENLNCTALEMSYRDSDLSMFVLLPNEREGLKDLAQKLKTVNLIDLAEQMQHKEVVVKFPKFKVEYSTELNETFKKLGITKMFEVNAEFDNILESTEPICVSKILHKACIEVNEDGTEAAAATAMMMMVGCTMCRDMPMQFQADHPFFYVIWNRNNILFAGAFVNV